MARIIKPESPFIQGVCVTEGCNNLQHHKGKGVYRAQCGVCHRDRYKQKSNGRRVYAMHKGDSCEACGFIPKHPCQLDVDHINGDHSDNRRENLQTLCANCHRLKTYLNKDWET